MSGLYPTMSPGLPGMLAADTGAEMIGVADGRTLAEWIESDGLFNGGTRKFTRWQAALAKSRTWAGRAYVAIVGNSVPAGVGSNGGDGQTDARKNAWPTVLADALTKCYNGYARANSVWGDSFVGMNLPTFDPRVTLGSGWVISNTFCLGGHALKNETTNSGTGIALSFEPDEPTDTCDIYYITYPGYSYFVTEVNADGVNLGTFNSHGNEGIAKATITAPLGQNRWDISKSTPGTLMIVGIDAYRAETCRTSVWNMGASGSTASHWATGNAPYNFRNALPAVAPDLTIIALTINDWAGLAGSDPVNYKRDMSTIIAAAKISGDVLLMVDIPSNAGTASLADQARFRGYCYELAVENDVPLQDLTYRWRSQLYLPMLGRYHDGVHPSKVGNADIAYAVAKEIGNP
ncbi:SGNH/GDSL hydrolase family protein [Janthinobacterium sp. Ant5-2-1]|uniref:SGNH/GDSL hydrolase family protein n=1 Tax=Janthinobacterium sp. Ant5-2-1 TaxID=1755239 RepID=UPI000718221D|nr:SGNH/GDSL hydrolase family protein [Janthinobacterium sp. Ant5-2-1]